MSLLCRLGWHDWGHWVPRRLVHRRLVVDGLTGKRRPDDDFTEVNVIQVRKCQRCGLEQERE